MIICDVFVAEGRMWFGHAWIACTERGPLASAELEKFSNARIGTSQLSEDGQFQFVPVV